MKLDQLLDLPILSETTLEKLLDDRNVIELF